MLLIVLCVEILHVSPRISAKPALLPLTDRNFSVEILLPASHENLDLTLSTLRPQPMRYLVPRWVVGWPRSQAPAFDCRPAVFR